jgi:hypothetical protein
LLELGLLAVFGCAYERRFALHSAAQISPRSSRCPTHTPTLNSALLSAKTPQTAATILPTRLALPLPHSYLLEAKQSRRASTGQKQRENGQRERANEQRARVQRTSYNRIQGSKRITSLTSSSSATPAVASSSASCPCTARASESRLTIM